MVTYIQAQRQEVYPGCLERAHAADIQRAVLMVKQ